MQNNDASKLNSLDSPYYFPNGLPGVFLSKGMTMCVLPVGARLHIMGNSQPEQHARGRDQFLIGQELHSLFMHPNRYIKLTWLAANVCLWKLARNDYESYWPSGIGSSLSSNNNEMPFTDQSKNMTAVSATLCRSGLGTFTGFFLTVCIHFLSCLFCACDGPLWVHSCGWGLLKWWLVWKSWINRDTIEYRDIFWTIRGWKKSSNAQAKYTVWRSRNWPSCFHTTVSSASDAPANHPKGWLKRYKQSPIMKGTSTHSSMNPGLLLSIHIHIASAHIKATQ